MNRIPPNFKGHVNFIWESGGILPPGSFLALTDSILELDPEAKIYLERFTLGTEDAIKQLPQHTVASLAAQKEALNTALSFANIDRDPLLEWTVKKQNPASFLDGLPQVYLREDILVFNDMNYIPGLEKIKSSVQGTAQFSNDQVRLDVIYANRTSLEELTGTDLIYFNATYRSFIMVQYKVMEHVEGSGAIFRLPNTQLAVEINRMKNLLSLIEDKSSPENRHGYRLTCNPFFLKMCKRVILDPDAVDLTPGMYFSLDHWKFLETDTDLTGPHGGRRISFENAGRYLTNTEFAALVQNAWIGTTPAQSEMLEAIISQILQDGKAIMVAIKSNKLMNPVY